MFRTLRVALGIMKFPFRLLWEGYRGLWWAFAEPPRPVGGNPTPGAAPEQESSFQIVDSTPKSAPPPLKYLRRGYRTMLVLSGLAAVGAVLAQSQGVVTTGHAFFLWAWCAGAACVGTLYRVRAWVRLDPSQGMTWRDQLRRLPGESCRAAMKAGGAVKAAATSPGVKAVAGGAKAAAVWSGRKSWWLAKKVPALLRPRVPQTRPTTA